MLLYMDSTLDALLPHSIPYECWRTIMDTLTLQSNIIDAFISSYDGQMSTSQCFHIEQHNAYNALDWEKSYQYENDNF